jgi:GntR family transcriptional regulator
VLIVVDPHSGVPVYRQLIQQIKFHVAGGMLKPGDELPSTRALSLELGVNPMTISKAYSYLEQEQVVERRPGRPLVVRAQTPDRRRADSLKHISQELAPVAAMARQFGLDPEEVLALFRALLQEEE